MPPTASKPVSDTDAQYLFNFFIDLGPFTLNVNPVAAARRVKASGLVSRLTQIKKRNPGLQITASAKNNGPPLSVGPDLATSSSTSALKSTVSGRKESGRAKAIVVFDKNEEDGDHSGQIVKSVSVSSKQSAPVPRDDSIKIHKDDEVTASRKRGGMSRDKSAVDREHSEGEDRKSTPKTRAARKNVGRELQNDQTQELPKAAPRGRHAVLKENFNAADEINPQTDEEDACVKASKGRGNKAADSDFETDASKIVASAGSGEQGSNGDAPASVAYVPIVKSAESMKLQDLESSLKTKSTNFVNRLITEPDETDLTSVKRKRTASVGGLTPSSMTDKNCVKDDTDSSRVIDAKTRRSSSVSGAGASDVLTREPATKKQRVGPATDDSKAVELIEFLAGGSVDKPVATSNFSQARPILEDNEAIHSNGKDCQITAAANPRSDQARSLAKVGVSVSAIADNRAGLDDISTGNEAKRQTSSAQEEAETAEDKPAKDANIDLADETEENSVGITRDSETQLHQTKRKDSSGGHNLPWMTYDRDFKRAADPALGRVLSDEEVLAFKEKKSAEVLTWKPYHGMTLSSDVL